MAKAKTTPRATADFARARSEAKLLRGGEVREFAVPADATSWTVEWR